jgi:hypothetical protein
MSSYPKSLDFSSLDPMAVAANSQMVVSLPESSRIANPDDISRIRVSTGMAGAYLNCAKSFLKFTVVNTTTYPLESAFNKNWTAKVISPLILDLSAMSCIKKIEWYSSSNLLESINNYNVLSAIMIDCQMSSEATHTSGDILGLAGDGFKNSTYYCLVKAAGANATSNNSNPVDGAGLFTPWWFIPPATCTDGTTNLYAGLNVVLNNGAAATDALILGNRVLETSSASPGTPSNAVAYGNHAIGLVHTDAPDGWVQARVAGNVTANAGLLTNANQLRGLHENSGANGADLRISRVGPVIPFGGKLTVCLPLLSMFGTLSCRMYPIHALSSPLMLHIYWDSIANVQCLRWTPGHTNISHADPAVSLPAAGLAAGSGVPGSSTYMAWAYQMTDIEYHANIVTLSGEAQAVIDQMTGGVYQISTSSYRHYSNTIPAGSTQNEILVPARFSSLKSLFHCLRPQQNLNNATHFSISERIKNYFTRAQLRIGSALYPSQPIEMTNNYYQPAPTAPTTAAFTSGPTGSAPQAYSLLINALGSSINTLNIPCNMNGEVYANNNGSLATNSDGAYYIQSHCGSTAGFVLGFDVESFGPSDTCSGPLSAGLNTLGISIYLALSVDAINLGTATITATPFDSSMVVACQVDSFAHFDLVATVAGGSMSVRF